MRCTVLCCTLAPDVPFHRKQIMAKTRTPRQPATKKQTEVEVLMRVLMDPKAVHELLGIVGPYDTSPEPIPTKGYVT